MWQPVIRFYIVVIKCTKCEILVVVNVNPRRKVTATCHHFLNRGCEWIRILSALCVQFLFITAPHLSVNPPSFTGPHHSNFKNNISFTWNVNVSNFQFIWAQLIPFSLSIQTWLSLFDDSLFSPPFTTFFPQPHQKNPRFG